MQYKIKMHYILPPKGRGRELHVSHLGIPVSKLLEHVGIKTLVLLTLISDVFLTETQLDRTCRAVRTYLT